jgi:hypothetical protein
MGRDGTPLAGVGQLSSPCFSYKIHTKSNQHTGEAHFCFWLSSLLSAKAIVTGQFPEKDTPLTLLNLEDTIQMLSGQICMVQEQLQQLRNHFLLQEQLCYLLEGFLLKYISTTSSDKF